MAFPKLKIFIVDDHYLILQGLSSLLRDEPRFEICGLSKDPAEVMGLLATAHADILLTDISMPGISGLELTAMVLKKFPHIKVIALSMYAEPQIVNQMIEAGVSGYLLKATSKNDLINALTTVAGGRSYFTAEVQQGFNARNQASVFTGRELEILQLIVKEFNNKQIAHKLFISERTVETHRRNILRKTDSANTVGLVRYAYENKLI